MALPRVVANDDDRRGIGSFIRVQQRTPHERRHARHSECGARDLRHLDRLAPPIADVQIALERAIGAQVCHRSQRLSPGGEVVGDVRLRSACDDVPVPDGDDAVAVRKRNGRPDDLRRKLEGPGPEPDRERHSEPAHDRESRIAHEHPEPELEVEPRHAEIVHASEPARPSALFLVSFGAAEFELRLPQRRGLREAGANEVGRAQLDVKAELVVHVRFDITAQPNPAPHRARPRNDSPQHQTSCGVAASDRAMASASRFQLAVSSPSRRRPSTVRR